MIDDDEICKGLCEHRPFTILLWLLYDDDHRILTFTYVLTFFIDVVVR